MIEPNPSLEKFLFEAALAKSSEAERVAFLDDVCGGNPALRARLDLLLEGQFEAQGFLKAGARKVGQPAPPMAEDEAASTFIGRYKLLEKIGEGGFGEVWMAEQKEPVKRRVALKIIKLGMDTKQVVARFEAERQALALMDHPNIAKVFDAGATDPGRPYFVMELVRGVRITEYCDTNRLSTRDRLKLFSQVCHAIQHAHQKGIIHRDIKPSNILVTRSEADLSGVPKVIDFGIAKATQQELTEKTVFTQFRQFLGTPAYVSPEQAAMTSVDIDTRSDIYSLGVLLYELLTGKTPFDSAELLAASLDEVRHKIREMEPVRPSTRLSALARDELTTAARCRGTEPPKLIGQVRGDLDWIVMKCLEKDRARRYETANGLARDLERHLNNEPIVARPPSRLYEFQKTMRRHWVGFAAVAAVLAALSIGVVVSWRAETVAKQRLAESETISKFLSELFQSPDPARDGRTITVAESLAGAAKKLESELANQPYSRAALQSSLAWTYHTLGLDQEAIALQEKVRTYFLTTFGLERRETLRAMHILGILYHEVGRRDEALKLREQVLPLCRKVSGPEHPQTLAAMDGLAVSYMEAGRVDEALKLREQVLPLCRKVSGPEHPQTRAAMEALAVSYMDAGRLDEALKLREQVWALLRKVRGPEHPDTLVAMHALANSYSSQRLDEALKLFEQVEGLARKVLGPEHPQTLQAMNDLADCYDKVGRYDEALKLLEQLLPLRRKVSGPEHPRTFQVMNNLAYCYYLTGRYDEALRLREQALALSRKMMGPEHPDTLDAMNNLAVSYLQAGRLEEALKLLEQVLAPRRKLMGPEHPDTLLAMRLLAACYDKVGRRDEALKLGEQTLALSRKVMGPEHRDTLDSMNNLALSYQHAGRLEEALKLFERVFPGRRKVLGPEHPDTLLAMRLLATCYDQAGRRDEALKLREQALPLRRKVSGPEHSETLVLMSTLAVSYYEAGRLEEALKLQEELLVHCRKSLCLEDTVSAMHTLSTFYDHAGRRDEALKLREQVLELSRKVSGPEHTNTLAALENLAISYQETGRLEEALKLRQQLLVLNSKVLGPEHTNTLANLNETAWLLATCSASEIRNGTNAVQLAEAAVAGTQRLNPGFLDTLAAACAEAQQFDKAVAVQEEAIALLHTEEEKADYGSRLKLYQANKPFRVQRNP
jgi:serine/threonine protein kinase/Flp pilus assembly protein TadD